LSTNEVYDSSEQDELLAIFTDMLGAPTRDGGRKRARGDKPSWKVDPSHEAAIFSHLDKWKHGMKKDPVSGAHPLVHLAWRALAIAWQETNEAVPWYVELMDVPGKTVTQALKRGRGGRCCPQCSIDHPG
jgi:hypothetical protein